MTGHFAPAPRSGRCPSSTCENVIQAGDQVYLFKGVMLVCRFCAKRRWGYEPSDEKPAASGSSAIGFDSTRSILKRLSERANANDPRMRQAGGDR